MLPGCQPGNKRGKKEEAKTNQVTYAIGMFPKPPAGFLCTGGLCSAYWQNAAQNSDRPWLIERVLLNIHQLPKGRIRDRRY